MQFLRGKSVHQSDAKVVTHFTIEPTKVKRQWWEGNDLCVELHDGSSWRYENAAIVSMQVEQEGVEETTLQTEAVSSFEDRILHRFLPSAST